VKKSGPSTFKISHAPHNELVEQAIIKTIFVDVFHIHFDFGKPLVCL